MPDQFLQGTGLARTLGTLIAIMCGIRAGKFQRDEPRDECGTVAADDLSRVGARKDKLSFVIEHRPQHLPARGRPFERVGPDGLMPRRVISVCTDENDVPRISAAFSRETRSAPFRAIRIEARAVLSVPEGLVGYGPW